MRIKSIIKILDDLFRDTSLIYIALRLINYLSDNLS